MKIYNKEFTGEVRNFHSLLTPKIDEFTRSSFYAFRRYYVPGLRIQQSRHKKLELLEVLRGARYREDLIPFDYLNYEHQDLKIIYTFCAFKHNVREIKTSVNWLDNMVKRSVDEVNQKCVWFEDLLEDISGPHPINI